MAEQKQNQAGAVPATQADNSIVGILSQGDKGKVTYTVNGQDVSLSYGIVRKFLTRGNGTVTDSEVVMFISLCKYNQLNPFQNDCYLVKYDEKSPAQMVTSKESFMKRGESNENYEGFQAGVIIVRNNEVQEQEGSFTLPTDQLVGGWCKVYRTDRKVPVIARVSFSEYNTGKSTWSGKPATMIRKVAIAQAFREAFPNMAGIYMAEEIQPEYQTQPGDDNGAAAAAAVETAMTEQQPGQPMTFAAPAAKEATASATAPAAEQPAPAGDGVDHNPGF